MAEAKDQKSAPVSLKSASLDQLWSCLQRCLLFEEPSSRRQKLISQLSRHVNGKARDLSLLSFADQQRCFKKIFGTPDDLLDLTARCFNLVLAMQDLRRFEGADFEICYILHESDKADFEVSPVFEEIAAKVLESSPSAAQTASLMQAWNVVPYWRVLESCGPWSDDPLADFAAAFLHQLDGMPLALSRESATACEAAFSKLLNSRRAGLPSNFQPSLLVLVEGVTETILLPRFLQLSCAGRHRQEAAAGPAAMFIACGGANQLLRKYLHMQDITRLPILCVADHDAEEQIKTIRSMLRKIDHLHVWSEGEIEDTFSRETLLENLNAYLPSLGAADLLQPDDLDPQVKRTELLDRLWRNRALGDFDKVDFAEFLVRRLKQVQDIPAEGRRLIDTLKQMATGGHG